MPIERMAEDDLRELARRVVTNEVYVAWTPEMMEYSFGAMLRLAGPSLAEEDVLSIGLVYDDMANAGERAINGYPMFLSMKLMHKDDVETFVDLCRRIDEAMRNA